MKRQPIEHRGSIAAGRPFRVAILAVGDDAAVAAQIAGSVRDAGAAVTSATTDGERWDGLVVLMSEGAVRDPTWRRIAAEGAAHRLVPVRLGAIEASEVPERLAEINWIDWPRADPTAAFGSVIAALYADPVRHLQIRQLTHEARTWVGAGRPAGMLIDDFRHASRMNDMLEELAADELVAPVPAVAEYVATSVALSRRLRRRRLRWRIAAVVLVLLVGSWAMDALPQVLDRSKMNRAAIVTLGSGGLLDQSTEWVALNAAQLVIEGSEDQKDLGRRTLILTLNRPWPIGQVDYVDSPLSAAPFDGGRRAAILALNLARHSAVAIVEPGKGSFLGSLALPQRFDEISAVAGSHATLSGPGLGILDLEHMSYTDVAREGVEKAWALNDRLVAAVERHELVLRDQDGRRVGSLGRHDDVLDARSGPDGLAAILVKDGASFTIVNAVTRRRLARVRMPQGTTTAVLAPDARHAAVIGDDDDVWRFGVDAPARPTGIATPPRAVLLWPAARKLVVVGDGAGGRVVSLPSGETLGRVCSSIPHIETPRADPGGEVVTCDARGFWRLPPGPVAGGPMPAEKLPRELSGRLADAHFDGSMVRLRWHGGPGSDKITGWAAPLNSRITAAAWSPSGDQLLLGGDNGGAAIMTISHDASVQLIGTDVPDHSPVTAVRWTEGPLARTAAGHTWQVPSCDGCGTDAGLIAAVRRRVGGCFTVRQLSFTTERVQHRLGLRTCDPVHHLE